VVVWVVRRSCCPLEMRWMDGIHRETERGKGRKGRKRGNTISFGGVGWQELRKTPRLSATLSKTNNRFYDLLCAPPTNFSPPPAPRPAPWSFCIHSTTTTPIITPPQSSAKEPRCTIAKSCCSHGVFAVGSNCKNAVRRRTK